MLNQSKKIRMQMIAKDLTGVEIARSVGVHRTSIYKAINGKLKSFRLRKAIADALGVKVTVLWPETKGKA